MAEYIEREALLEDIENSLVFSVRPDGQNPKQMGARLVVQRIRCAPAANVVPVVHGRWIRAAAYNDGVLNTAYCSVCRNFLPAYNWDYHNYCPNCGARMDGE